MAISNDSGVEINGGAKFFEIETVSPKSDRQGAGGDQNISTSDPSNQIPRSGFRG
jgi:hypothetical protein